jgi:hypothetical protein
MNLPKIDQANKVVYQRPKEKRNGTKETVYQREEFVATFSSFVLEVYNTQMAEGVVVFKK